MKQVNIKFDLNLRAKFREGRDERRHLDVFESILSSSQYRLTYRTAKKYLKQGMTVLDWGVGSGHFSLFLRTLPLSVYGYSLGDGDRQMAVDLAQDSGYTHSSGSDPVKLPFPDNSFDAIFALGVLEHVREGGGNEADSLKELNRILRKDGLLIIFHLPQRWSWIEWIVRRQKKQYYHPYRYHMHEATELITKNHFNIEWSHRYGALPRNEIARRLPNWLSDKEWFCKVYNSLDYCLSRIFPPFVQNMGFVCRKNN